MHSARELLRTRPQLQVLHLFRDPRAVAVSRRRQPWSQGSETNNSIAKIASLYCKTVTNDLKYRIALEKEFPGRIMQVALDEFVQTPLSYLTSIYSFVGISSHKLTIEELNNLTLESQRRSLKWSNRLTFSQALEIRENCERILVFKQL